MNQYVILVRLREQSQSSSGLRNPSQIITDAVQKHQGKVLSAVAMLGYHDICIIAQFPTQEDAFGASATLKVQNGWLTETNAAQPLANFDKIYSEASQTPTTSSRRT